MTKRLRILIFLLAGCWHSVLFGQGSKPDGKVKNQEDIQELYHKGMEYLYAGKGAEAEQSAGRIIAVSPEEIAAYQLRGDARFSLGQLDSAWKDYTVVESAMQPVKDAKWRYAGYAMMGIAPQGKQTNDVSAWRYYMAYTLMNKALILADRKNLTEAVSYHQKSIAANPGSAQFRGEYAQTLDAMGHMDEAARSYLQAARMGYQPARMYAGAGILWSRMGDNRKASLFLDSAVRLDTGIVMNYFHRGLARLEIGRFKEAEQDFRYFLQRQPADAMGAYYLGLSLAQQNQNKEALKIWHALLEEKPGFHDAWFRIGLAYANDNDFAAAIGAFDEAIAQYPKQGFIYYNRAMAKGRLSSRLDPCEDLRTALSLGYKEAEVMLKKVCK